MCRHAHRHHLVRNIWYLLIYTIPCFCRKSIVGSAKEYVHKLYTLPKRLREPCRARHCRQDMHLQTSICTATTEGDTHKKIPGSMAQIPGSACICFSRDSPVCITAPRSVPRRRPHRAGYCATDRRTCSRTACPCADDPPLRPCRRRDPGRDAPADDCPLQST